MTRMTEAEKLRVELEAWRRTTVSANSMIEKLEAELKALETPAPPPGSWVTVEVKFHTSPNWYRYLILHVPGKGFYTTGTLDENKHFATWYGLLAYFNKDDVEMRSAFHTLTPNTPSYGGSIERGER